MSGPVNFLAPLSKLGRSLQERGLKGMIIQLYTIGDLKYGELKGTDKFGNRYYEDLELPFGQHRWVEYNDIHNFDASMIQPEWHGWIHHVFDETPNETMKKDVLPAAANPDAIYDHHKGHTEPYKVYEQTNVTQYRQRGYKIGSLKTEDGESDKYYKQPTHPLSLLKKEL
jgi:NADH:ubiquinone oxidoreductase subunit